MSYEYDYTGAVQTETLPAGRYRIECWGAAGGTVNTSYPGGKGDYYYDDNEWVCIQLLLGYGQLGKRELLSAALDNLEFIWTGWDSSLDGGIFWSSGYDARK